MQHPHCLSICAQPYQRFNTYCFELHQSLPLLPSNSPSSRGSFFSVSFYYFASSSFSPLTSPHIILPLVAFSSPSQSFPSSSPFLPPLITLFAPLNLFPLVRPPHSPFSLYFQTLPSALSPFWQFVQLFPGLL